VFVILVYDVNEKRVAKALKICRKYLYWVRNSVFEGEITFARLEQLKVELRKSLNAKEDSVIIYQFDSMKYSHLEILGLRRGGQTEVL